MIIYGVRTKQIAKETLIDKCPNCSTQYSVDLPIVQRYFHVFWIPFFPVGKSALSQCTHCKQVLKKSKMPATFLAAYQNLKSNAKTPIWMFSGIALLTILVVALIIGIRNDHERNKKYITDPKPGDVLEIRLNYGQYTLYKIDKVTPDSVYVLTSEYESNKISGLRNIKQKGKSAYSDELTGFSMDDLKKMLDKDEVMDVRG